MLPRLLYSAAVFNADFHKIVLAKIVTICDAWAQSVR